MKKRSKLKISTVFMVHRFAAKKNIVIYKVNRREYYCSVDLPLSDYPLFGKSVAARA